MKVSNIHIGNKNISKVYKGPALIGSGGKKGPTDQFLVAGDNYYGELGLGHFDTISPAISHPQFNASDVESFISNSGYNNYATLLLLKDGTIGGAGANYNGRLGVDTEEEFLLEFTQETRGDTDGVGVDFRESGGGAYALKSDGTIGVNGYYSPLFNRDTGEPYPEFVQMQPELTDFVDGDGGLYGAALIDSSGRLYSIGLELGSGLGDDYITEYDENYGYYYSYFNFTYVSQFGTNVSKVRIGEQNIVVLLKDGTIGVSGGNAGAIGLGQDDYDLYDFEQEITYSTDGVDLDVYATDLVAIKSDGTLGGAGYNQDYMLGLGHNNNVFTLTQIGTDTDGKKVCMGSGYTTFVLKEDDTLGVAGSHGNYVCNRAKPQVKEFTQITEYTFSDLSANGGHYLLLQNGISSYSFPSLLPIPEEPQLYSIGRNGYGGLGLGYYGPEGEMTPLPNIFPNLKHITSNARCSMLLTTTGELGAAGLFLGEYYPYFIQVLLDSIGLDVSGHYNTISLIKSDGTLGGTDRISGGSSELETEDYNFRQINEDTDGTNIQQGDDRYDVLTYFAGKGNSLYAGGYNGSSKYNSYVLGVPTDDGDYTRIPTHVGDDFIKVSPAYTHTLFLKSDGTLWGAGSGNYLGLSSNTGPTTEQLTTDSYIDISATGSRCSLVIKDDGTLGATGYNYYGQLGLGDTNNRYGMGEQVGTDTNGKKVTCIARSSYALKTDGSIGSCGLKYTNAMELFDNGPFENISVIGCDPFDNDSFFGIKNI